MFRCIHCLYLYMDHLQLLSTLPGKPFRATQNFIAIPEHYGVISYNIKKDFGKSEVPRAIDGARTRGLDLGKVARYQLRHYRTSG